VVSGDTVTESGVRGAFIGLFIATGAAMLGFGLIEPIMPLYAESLGASSLMLGVIFAGFAVTRGIFAPIMGRLSDRYGRKRILLAGLGLYVLLSAAYILANSPLTLTAVRASQGLASVMVTPIAQSYVGDITPEGEEGAYMNLFYISLFGGMAIGPSFEAPFLVLAAVAFFGLLVVLFLVPERAPTEGSAGESPSLLASLSAVFDDPEMRGILSYITARGFYRWGFNSFFPVYAVTVVALSRTNVGFILSGYMLAGGVLQYPLGRLADRFAGYRPEFVVVGGLVSGLTMFVVPSTTGLLPLLALVVGMGVSSAVSRSASVAIRTERGRVHGMGAVTGAFTASTSVGQIFGPVTFGAVTDVLSIRWAFYLGGVVGLLGTAGAYWYLRVGGSESARAVNAAKSD